MVLGIEDELPRIHGLPPKVVNLLPSVQDIVLKVVFHAAANGKMLSADYTSPATMLDLIGTADGWTVRANKSQVVVAQIVEVLGGVAGALRYVVGHLND